MTKESAAEGIAKRLVGEELATLTKDLSESGKTERQIAEAAGYYTIDKKTGEKKAKFLPFRSALLKATSGFTLRNKVGSVSDDGFAKASKTGQLVIASRFLRNFSSNPETLRFKVDVTKTGIILTIAKPEEPEEVEEAEAPEAPVAPSFAALSFAAA
jgi:hypothetical protein